MDHLADSLLARATYHDDLEAAREGGTGRRLPDALTGNSATVNREGRIATDLSRHLAGSVTGLRSDLVGDNVFAARRVLTAGHRRLDDQ